MYYCHDYVCVAVNQLSLESERETVSECERDWKRELPLTQRPQWVSQWVWCFQWAQLHYSCYRCLRLSSEDHLDSAWEETCTNTHIQMSHLLTCVIFWWECVCVRESSPGPVLFQEGVLGVERSAVELQSGESSVVQSYRLLHCGHVLPWREKIKESDGVGSDKY